MKRLKQIWTTIFPSSKIQHQNNLVIILERKWIFWQGRTGGLNKGMLFGYFTAKHLHSAPNAGVKI